MILIRVLIVGTQQSGKTTLLKLWTGLSGGSIGQNTRRPFESAARWGEYTAHIRDTVAVDSLTKEFPVYNDLEQQKPDVILLLGNNATYPFTAALAYLAVHTTVPILVLLGKSDLESSLVERRENARVELSSFHREIANAFDSGRITVQNAVIYPSRAMTPSDIKEVYDASQIREWVIEHAPVVVPNGE